MEMLKIVDVVKQRIKIELFTLDVGKFEMRLDDKVLDLQETGDGEWKVELLNYDSMGPIEIDLYAEGVEGAPWEMRIRVNGKVPVIYRGFIQDGYAIKKVKIPILSDN